jgi:hypothetical protein
MVAGLLGASLLLSPLAYAAEEGTQGSTMTEGHKTATKGTKKKHTAKKGTTKKKTEKTPEKTE